MREHPLSALSQTTLVELMDFSKIYVREMETAPYYLSETSLHELDKVHEGNGLFLSITIEEKVPLATEPITDHKLVRTKTKNVRDGFYFRWRLNNWNYFAKLEQF